MPVLDVNIETAGYESEREVIRDIRFQVHRGQIVGLIGPNGAGKSTTIKAILGLLREVKGHIAFANGEPNFAYVPEQPILYDQLTLWEHLRLAASAFGLDEAEFGRRADALLARFRLEEVKHHYPTGFSKGMQQKVMLILGFLHEPDLYVVDEPFIGLDPYATKDLLELLAAEKERGAGILMCTHVLGTAERICDSFLLLSDGKLLAQGSLEQLNRQCGLSGASLFDCFLALTGEGPPC